MFEVLANLVGGLDGHDGTAMIQLATGETLVTADTVCPLFIVLRGPLGTCTIDRKPESVQAAIEALIPLPYQVSKLTLVH